MAKIEMDLSEFKLMEENKKLLQDALEREQELKLKIEQLNAEKQRLNEEKIKAYEESAQNVQYITTIENREVLIHYNEYLNSIDELNEYNKFAVKFRVDANNNSQNSEIYKQALIELIHSIQSKAQKEVRTSKTIDVKSKGLDIVKEEIRTQLESEIEQNTKNKLKQLEIVLENLYAKEQELKELSKKYDEVSKKEEGLLVEIETLKQDSSIHKGVADKYRNFFLKVSEITFSTKFFYKKAAFNDIKELVKSMK
jgi:hypothetical protein